VALGFYLVMLLLQRLESRVPEKRMPTDQFEKGLNNIKASINDALMELHVSGARVSGSYAERSRGADLSVAVDGKQATQAFSYDEITDSGEAIDAPAAHKVRMLVSHFVR
jgi:hypothetical protein